MKNVILVFLGGGLGSVLRYGAGLLLSSGSKFPWATLLVNIAASFVLGLWVQKPDPTWRMFLAIGFCGGLSTFSTFSNESLQLLFNQHFLLFSLNLLLSTGLCLLAVWAGMTLVR